MISIGRRRTHEQAGPADGPVAAAGGRSSPTPARTEKPSAPGESLFAGGHSWDVTASGCVFRGNAVGTLDAAGLVEVSDCVFEDNAFDRKPVQVANNGGHYVKRGGAVYFRETTPDSAGVAYAMPGETTSVMCRLNADGGTEGIFADNGSGGIFLYDDGEYAFFVLTRAVDAEGGAADPTVYGVSLDGSSFWEYGPGELFAVDTELGVVILSDGSGGLNVADAVDPEKTLLYRSGPCTLLHYDATESVLYYEGDSAGGKALYACWLRDPEAIELELLTAGDIADVFGGEAHTAYRRIVPDGEFVRVYLARYEGSLGALGDSALLEVAMLGGYRRETNPRGIDWFGTERPFSAGAESPVPLGKESGYWMFDAEGALVEVLSADDMAQAGLPEGEYYGEEDYAVLQHAEYVDGALFFTVESGTRNREEDIGWRYGYERGLSRVYCKDLAGGGIRQIEY
jgi:hypothetical protein